MRSRQQCGDRFARAGPELVAEPEAAQKPSAGRQRHAGPRVAAAGPIGPAEAVDRVADPALEARPGMLAEIGQHDHARIAGPSLGGDGLRIGMTRVRRHRRGDRQQVRIDRAAIRQFGHSAR